MQPQNYLNGVSALDLDALAQRYRARHATEQGAFGAPSPPIVCVGAFLDRVFRVPPPPGGDDRLLPAKHGVSTAAPAAAPRAAWADDSRRADGREAAAQPKTSVQAVSQALSRASLGRSVGTPECQSATRSPWEILPGDAEDGIDDAGAKGRGLQGGVSRPDEQRGARGFHSRLAKFLLGFRRLLLRRAAEVGGSLPVSRRLRDHHSDLNEKVSRRLLATTFLQTAAKHSALAAGAEDARREGVRGRLRPAFGSSSRPESASSAQRPTAAESSWAAERVS